MQFFTKCFKNSFSVVDLNASAYEIDKRITPMNMKSAFKPRLNMENTVSRSVLKSVFNHYLSH